ncbi:MAG: MYXO-CTERM sorting domain-containing protein [Polyangiaceae bacterium]
MRRFSFLSSISASLVALTLCGAAAAAPGLVTKTGQFEVQGASSSASKSSLVSAAREVLDAQIDASRGLSLDPARVVTLSSGDRVVKLRQSHQGVPVVSRGASVTFRGGVARLVSAHVESDLPSDVTPDLTSDAAAGIAEARTGMAVAEEQIALALWPTPEGTRLVWALGAEAIPGVPYQPVTVVDAKSGEIIYVYNAVRELNLSKVYPSNPIKSPTLVDVTLPVGEGETVLQNELVQTLNCIDQKTVKAVNFMGFNLDVHTCDLLQTAVADANGDFLIAPGADNDPEDAFSEISMFHHVNRAYDMFRGWDKDLNVNGGKAIPTVSNLRIPQGFDTFDLNKIKDPNLPLQPFQNAFFAPANPIFSSVFGLDGAAMWFGQGPKNDYAYDGDVVYHEFVHAVVNATIQLVGTPHMDEYGTSMSPGGMNEGLADYFSSALTGDGDVGEYASQDFFPGSVAIRSLTNPDACPSAIGGEVHQDATLFSGAIWDVRVKLSPDDQVKLDEAVFAAMNASPTGDLSYEQMANLIIEQTKTILSDAAAAELTTAFTGRGILPQCSRILEYKGDVLTGPPDLSNLWFAPGTQTTGAKNSAGGWTPGVVQVHYALPENTGKLDINIKEVNIGGGGGFGGGGTPFTPKFLIRWGKDPITFTYKPTSTNPDVVALDAVKTGVSNHVLSVDVPAGATDVYIMVGSTGQSDGAYTNFLLTPTPGMNPGTGGAGGMSAGGAGGAGGGNGGSGAEDVTVEGCGCTVPGDSHSGEGAAFAAIAALGLIASRRRKRG